MNDIARETLFASNESSENEKIRLLKQHFPNCFDKHGAFLPEKLAETLRSDGIPAQKEGYSLNWLGKSYARVLKDAPPETLLAEDAAHNQKPENRNSENVLIRGDNLEVLKHLKNAYKNQVKMIYIDPPYNTGSDGFIYQDDRKFTPEQLAELGGMDLDEAARVLDFTAKKSNSHSAWLTFMYPRLYIARELLHDDGVIFISIDDNEQAQLKILCDEIFGEENFVAELVVNAAPAGSQSSNDFAQQHQYCFVYKKTNNFLIAKLSLSNEELDKKYSEKDEFGSFYIERLWKRGIGGKMEDVPSLHFPIYFDKTNEKIYIDEEINSISNQKDVVKIIPYQTRGVLGRWTWSKNKMKNERDKLKVAIIADEYKLHKKVYRDQDEGKKPFSIIDAKLGRTELGSLEVKKIFNEEKYFDYPKSTIFIKHLLQMQKEKSALILDFFAGSGTTAHAVMQLNAEDGGNRRFICVQLPEETDKKSEASKAGYQTIFDITKARIEKAAAKIQAAHPDYQGDLGFKIFQTEPNFQTALDTDLAPNHELFASKNAVLTPIQLDTLLTTWRVYDGAALTEKVQAVDLAGYTAYYCRRHLYLLASGFASEQVKALIGRLDNDADFVPERIVLFGENIESAMQKELAQAVKTYANKKGLSNLSVLARY